MKDHENTIKQYAHYLMPIGHSSNEPRSSQEPSLGTKSLPWLPCDWPRVYQEMRLFLKSMGLGAIVTTFRGFRRDYMLVNVISSPYFESLRCLTPCLVFLRSKLSTFRMDSLPTHQKAIAFVGLGHGSLNTAIESICSSPIFILTAICEPNQEVLQQARKRYPKVLCFSTIDQLLDHCNSTEDKLSDCAYVAIPHNQYILVIPNLLRNGIHVLKEKPAGVTSVELEHF